MTSKLIKSPIPIASIKALTGLEVCNESFATSNKVVPTKTNERALAAGGAQ